MGGNEALQQSNWTLENPYKPAWITGLVEAR